jgi:hypothetical protein
MTAELAPYQPPPNAVEHAKAEAVQRLATWAQSAQAAYEVAQRLAQTAFVPEAFRGNAADTTAAILAGSEVGLSPMASLRAFDIIQGTAAPRAITLRAVAQANGHDIEVVEATAQRCTVRCRRRGGNWQQVVWTMDRARSLSLANKHNWKAQPQAMLVARATAEAARIVAADAILGLNGGYAVEEIDNGADESTITMRREGTKRTAQRTKQVVSEAEPELEPTELPTSNHGHEMVTPAPEPDRNSTETEPETGDGITSAQLKKLGALMRENDITERSVALTYVSDVIGRQVASRNELTKHEASQVIDALEAEKNTDDEPSFDDNPGFDSQPPLT